MLLSPRKGKLCFLCLQATARAMSRRASSPWLCAVLSIQARTLVRVQSLSGAVLCLEQCLSLRKAFAPPAGARFLFCHNELLLSDTENRGDKWPLEGCPMAKVLRPF